MWNPKRSVSFSLASSVILFLQKVIHEPETLKVIEQSRLIIDLDYDKFMKILETRTK